MAEHSPAIESRLPSDVSAKRLFEASRNLAFVAAAVLIVGVFLGYHWKNTYQSVVPVCFVIAGLGMLRVSFALDIWYRLWHAGYKHQVAIEALPPLLAVVASVVIMPLSAATGHNHQLPYLYALVAVVVLMIIGLLIGGNERRKWRRAQGQAVDGD